MSEQKIVLTFNCIYEENTLTFDNQEYVKVADKPYTFISVNSVTTIGEEAFRCCKSLTTIDIPNFITYIGEYAFYECTSLTHIVIPASVTTIGYNIFQWCNVLTTVETNDEHACIIDYCKAYYPNVEVIVTNPPYVLK